MAHLKKSAVDRGKKPASPKRGMLRAVEAVKEPKPVHALSLRLPQDLFSRLKKAADEERRSVNNQIEVLVEAWLKSRKAEVPGSTEAPEPQEVSNNEEDEEVWLSGWEK